MYSIKYEIVECLYYSIMSAHLLDMYTCCMSILVRCLQNGSMSTYLPDLCVFLERMCICQMSVHLSDVCTIKQFLHSSWISVLLLDFCVLVKCLYTCQMSLLLQFVLRVNSHSMMIWAWACVGLAFSIFLYGSHFVIPRGRPFPEPRMIGLWISLFSSTIIHVNTQIYSITYLYKQI